MVNRTSFQACVGPTRIDATGKSVLVTGAAGFIGSHVARYCRDLGMKVVALDDMSGGFESNVPSGVTFVKGDITDAALLGSLFESHRFNYVYHLAAYAAEGLSHFVRSFNYRTNLVGSVELLNFAIKYKVECFVFTSSIAVYGSLEDMSEETRPQPEDPYGISKFAFEMDLHAAKELFDMDFVIFRPHNVYGPHQNMFDRYRNVVGIFINQISQNKPMTIFGDGEQTRAFSYIDDVAPVIAEGPLIPQARNEIFNVGADVPYTVNELSQSIAEQMGKPEHPVDHQPPRLEVLNAVSKHDKVALYFGAKSAVPLTEGLRRTVTWYEREGKSFAPVEFRSVEILEKMPPSWVREDLKETARCDGTRTDIKKDFWM